MIVRVDPSSPVPPYEQLRAQIARLIDRGELADGSRLPTIRQLARDLGLAEGTVARAYRELERDGSIEARRRHGSFVRRPCSAPGEPGRRLRDAAAEFARRAAEAGADPDEALALAREALRSASN